VGNTNLQPSLIWSFAFGFARSEGFEPPTF
jgi:hypothetical protein